MSEKKDRICVGFLCCPVIHTKKCAHGKPHFYSSDCCGVCGWTPELERLQYKCIKVTEEKGNE